MHYAGEHFLPTAETKPQSAYLHTWIKTNKREKEKLMSENLISKFFNTSCMHRVDSLASLDLFSHPLNGNSSIWLKDFQSFLGKKNAKITLNFNISPDFMQGPKRMDSTSPSRVEDQHARAAKGGVRNCACGSLLTTHLSHLKEAEEASAECRVRQGISGKSSMYFAYLHPLPPLTYAWGKRL